MVNIKDLWDGDYKKEMTYVDLFAGCGGMSKGFEMAGFKGIAALDFFHSACDTHRKNIPDCEVLEGDITLDETKQRLYEIVRNVLGDKELDCLHSSTPCQGFSQAGKREITDERNYLYQHTLEIISVLKPRYITMENVPGMVSMADGWFVKEIENGLEKIGYKFKWVILNSANYKVPQSRHRWILIGCRADMDKEIDFPEPLLTPDNYITLGEAIEDLMDGPYTKEFNHVPQRHSEDFKKRLEAVEEGKSLYGGESYTKSPWDKPSCTVKGNHGSTNIHPKLPRCITVREMARLQSFPDDFIFDGSVANQMVQIGNAVPCNLARAIAYTIVKLDE